MSNLATKKECKILIEITNVCYSVIPVSCSIMGHLRAQWRSWFRHCAASRKVAGSIPGVDLACDGNE